MAAFLRFLITSLGRYWARGLLILGGLLIEMGYNAGISISFKFLIDGALIPRDRQVLLLILGLLAGGVVLTFCISLGRDYLYAKVCTAIVNDLRQCLFSHLQHLSLDFYARTSMGDITARFATDLAAVEHALIAAVPGLFLPALDVLSSMLLLFVLEWRLALVALLVFPLSLIGPQALEKRASTAGYVRKQQESRVISSVQETFSAPAVMKAFGLERHMRTVFMRELRELAQSSVRVGFLRRA